MPSESHSFCADHHPFADRKEWEEGTRNHRVWVEGELEIAECLHCNSTLGWPSWFDERGVRVSG